MGSSKESETSCPASDRPMRVAVDADLMELIRFSQNAADWGFSGPSRELLLAGTDTPLPGSAFTLLRYLERFDSLRVSGLAEVVGVHPSTVSTQVRPLIEAGLVRSAPDPGDKRAARLSITTDGIRLCELVRERGAHNWGRVLSGWSADDLRQLAALLRRVHDDVMRTVAIAREDTTSGSSGSRLEAALRAMERTAGT
jgi:DNA-binding MarR family transcriptional regulator